MRANWRRSSLFLAFCVLTPVLIVVGEFSRKSAPTALPADTLVVATTYEPATLHPVFGSDRMTAVEIMGAVFEPLTVYDDHQRLIPCLAREIPTISNGGIRMLPENEARKRGGKLESIWHLRPDARWSDGEPVTAHDFIFTLEMILDERLPAVSREVEERIAKMEERDAGRTLVVLWKEPYAFAHEGHRHLVVPRHIEEPRYRNLVGDDRREYERTPFNREPTGNGPYRLGEWKHGRYMLLERNPFWHGPQPQFLRLIYQFTPESETVLANLDTGRLGAVSPVALDFDLGYEFDRRSQSRDDATYVVHYQPGLWWEHIDFNIENSITSDRRVRQALSHGLDRRALSRTLFAGQDLTTDTWLPSVHPAAFPSAGTIQPDLPRYPYDVDRAEALLSEAGWTIGAGGLRRKNGQALRLMLTIPTGEPLTDRAAQMVKEDWRRIGVELNLRLLDAGKFGESSAENRAYTGLSLYSWIMDPSADGITFWTTANIPTDANTTGQNTCRWRSAESDALLFRATHSIDTRNRVALMREQQRIWADDVPAIPLYFKQEISIRHQRLQGWLPTGTETPITWNCYEWHWSD